MTTQTRSIARPGLALVTKAQAKAVTKDTLQGLEKMVAQSEKFDAKKQDFPGSAHDFKFNAAGKVQRGEVVQLKGMQVGKSPAMGFTDQAFGQLLGRLSSTYFGDGTSKTMRREDWQTLQAKYPKHFASVMNDVLKEYGDNAKNRGLMMRAYDKQVRAVFTDLYGIVSNTDMLKHLHTILAPEADKLPEMKLVRSEVTPDDLLVQVVWKNITGENPHMNRPGDGTSLGENNTYGIGVAIRNGETGSNGIKVSPMIWRHSCTNSIIVKDDRAINLRHIGQQSALMAKIKIGMIDCLPLAAESLNQIYEAELTALPSIADVIKGFAAEYKWSDTITEAVMIGTEGKTTKMGVINGVSYAAHSATDGNTDLMVDMSTLAGTLLGSKIDVFNRAALTGAKNR